jgi:TRAP-type C4-dicarboxylate transport system substrate-binding protein
MARKLHNCAHENSYPNKSAEPYSATIWDRLSPDERRIINNIKDHAGKA